jgi:hypothetical protein
MGEVATPLRGSCGKRRRLSGRPSGAQRVGLAGTAHCAKCRNHRSDLTHQVHDMHSTVPGLRAKH